MTIVMPMDGAHGVAPIIVHVGIIVTLLEAYLVVTFIEIDKKGVGAVNPMGQCGIDVIEGILYLLVVGA